MITPEARIGIRTPATSASPEAWYVAHEAAGTWIAVAGWVITIAGLVVMLGQPDGSDVARIALIAVVLALAAIVFATVVGNRAASAVDDEGP